MSENTTEAISYEHIKISGYEVQSIKKLEINSLINNHSTLNLTGILDKENIDDIYSTTNNKTVEIYYNNGNRETIFWGIVVDIEIDVEDEVYEIKLKAKSMTYLMDIERKSRSFQDITLSMQDVINDVMSDYDNSNFIVKIPEKAIGELIIQYEETDWEFLCRLVSKYNIGLIPKMNNNIISYIAGDCNESKVFNNSNNSYEVFKDMKEYEDIKMNHLNDAKEYDYTTYKIRNYSIYNLGDCINIKGINLYAYECKYKMQDGILENTYKFRMLNGLRQKYLFNTKITGASISGKLVNVKNTLVQIHLDIDESEHNDVYWFDFSTMSASSDGSGWYFMPEIGDCIRVYFPTKYEQEAFAISAVSDYKQGESEKEDRMSNPDNKYLRTKNDKEVKLTQDGIYISCNSGQADMIVKSDGTVNILSKNNICVTGEKNIKIEAGKSIKMTSLKSLEISCDKNGGIIIDEEGLVKEIGSHVFNN
ncbi:contractile injection system protein, VgrG/Pvc8 family [Clostridium butyricum]|uniref:contractile injection system protein, VgrG/Pvc8 family n=1 Tax=Clostridium butyricum TaxID=1492 RepID=UPI00374FCA06